MSDKKLTVDDVVYACGGIWPFTAVEVVGDTNGGYLFNSKHHELKEGQYLICYTSEFNNRVREIITGHKKGSN